MLHKIKLREVRNSHGDVGLMEFACHPSLERRIFREENGGMAWAYETEFTAFGWAFARTYGSVFKVSDFEIEVAA